MRDWLATSPLEESSTFIPLSFKGEGEGIKKEASPLLDSPYSYGVFKRGVSPSFQNLPLPLMREGGQGDRATILNK